MAPFPFYLIKNMKGDFKMDSGSIGFMIFCTALVFIMTPALAFFYGGLVRRKNVINTMMASVFITGTAVLGTKQC